MGSMVENALETVPCDAVLAPTDSGTTPRIISRSKPRVWIIAPSRDAVVCQGLAFSYGVHAVDVPDEDSWENQAPRLIYRSGIAAQRVLLVAGPSPRNPKANHRIELMRFDADEIAAAQAS
jgi:pyruvate kinase